MTLIADDFECNKCGNLFEEIDEKKDRKKFKQCPECKGRAPRIISMNPGQIRTHAKSISIQDETPTWIDSCMPALQDDEAVRAGEEKPLDTRSEVMSYMKENELSFK